MLKLTNSIISLLLSSTNFLGFSVPSVYFACTLFKFINRMNFVYLPACLQISDGAHAIFGPSDPELGAYVQSVCDALEIPHLEVHLNTSMPII